MEEGLFLSPLEMHSRIGARRKVRRLGATVDRNVCCRLSDEDEDDFVTRPIVTVYLLSKDLLSPLRANEKDKNTASNMRTKGCCGC